MGKVKYIKFESDKLKNAGIQLAELLNKNPISIVDVHFTYSEFYDPNKNARYITEIAHLLYTEKESK